jgi:2-oxoglutarate ferredoxin oxidoreductase subunit delta
MAKKVQGYVEVDNEVCKGCELCVVACPMDVLEMSTEVNGKGYHYAVFKHFDKCVGCADCAVVCPDAVLTVYREKIEVE